MELKIGTDGDENLFINFKWPNQNWHKSEVMLGVGELLPVKNRGMC
jgi:hypothetical protein